MCKFGYTIPTTKTDPEAAAPLAKKMMEFGNEFCPSNFSGSLATFVNGSAQFLHIQKIKDICTITNLETFSFC